MSTRSKRIQENSEQRRERQKAATRQAILDSATELFREQGFEHFSLRQVAEGTGYSATTIYLYFEDKDDLLFHVALVGFQRFGQMLKEAYDSKNEPLERLAAISEAYVRFGLEHPVNYRLMFMQRGEFLGREAPEGMEKPIDSFAILRQTIEEGLAAGVIRPGNVDVYAATIWSTVHGLVALAISTPYFPPESIPGLVEALQEMVADGVRAAGEGMRRSE